MKVIDVLNELNITFDELSVYDPKFAEQSIYSNFLNQIVPEDIYNKIVQAHNRAQMKGSTVPVPAHKLLKGIKVSQSISPMLFFETENAYRFLGKIDWYYNKQTNGEYGYIKQAGITDVKFYITNCFGLEHKDLIKDHEVIVTVLKSNLYRKSINAHAVNSIAVEENPLFLLFHFINNFNELSSKTAKAISDRIGILVFQPDEQTSKTISLILDKNVNYSKISIDQMIMLFNFNHSIGLQNKSFDEAIFKLSHESKFQLWMNCIHFKHEVEPFHELLVKKLNQDPTKTEVIFNKLNEDEKLTLTNELITFYHNSEVERLQLPFHILKKYQLSFDHFYHKMKTLSAAALFNLWLKIENLQIEFEVLDLDFNHFKKELISHSVSNPISLQVLIERFETEKQIDILNTALQFPKVNYALLTEVVTLINDLNLSLNEDLISSELIVRLWYDGTIKNFPSKKVIAFLKESSVNRHLENEKKEEYSKIFFKKVSVVELENLIAEIFYSIDAINTDSDFEFLSYLIDSCNNSEFNTNFEVTTAKLVKKVYDKASAYYRLKLFIEDYTDTVEYHDVVIYTGLLSSEDQKIFFKKTLKLISENKVEITFEDLQKITTIDYEISEYAKEIDGVGLDFTLSIILQMVSDLKENKVTTRNTIFDIVASQIKRPNDLLQIKGFFDKCTGRTIIEKVHTPAPFDENDILENKIPAFNKRKKEKFLPRFSTYCDGRKATTKDSEAPLLCKKSGFEFWWCENSQCYDPCRQLHESNDWKNYNFEDVLNILKIQYVNSQYEILVNVINRVNRFLAHLTCRKCSSILKPKGKSNFAFHGVTYFSCKNTECEEHSKDIYLSHCLNGKCEDIIDSRDSPKCKTHGYKDECGWYICKNCNACCSSEKLRARKSILEQLGQEYKCHIEGHRDRGILCCSDCGNEMEERIFNKDLYNTQLKWFIERKDKHVNITKYGQRPKDKKWWFIWTRGRFSYDEYRKHLKGLFTSGFSIPDFNNKTKDSQLISEPFENTNTSNGRTFVCPNCDNTFDFSSLDFTRQNAVSYFHDKIFPKIKI